MKICMFVRNSIARDPRVKREAEYLVNAGHEVTVIGMVERGLPRKEIWRGVRLLRVAPLGAAAMRLVRRIAHRLARGRHPEKTRQTPAHRTPSGPTPATPPVASLGRLLRRLPANMSELTYLLAWVSRGLLCGAEAYHAHDLNTLRTAYICAKLRRARLIYDSHELWIDWRQNKCKDSPDRIQAWAALEAKVAPKAELVLTVSDGIAERLQGLYGIARPLVVRNCPPLKPIARSDKLRRLIGTDSTRPILLYQGGFIQGRGLRELVLAADCVPSADFVLIGGESEYKQQIRKAATAAKNANVHVLSYVPIDDLWQCTCDADIGVVLTQPVCLSYALSESNKIFEYMAAGLPVIASGIRSHRRLAEETGGIVLADPCDPRDIARAASQLLNEPQRTKQMAARARQWVECKYNTSLEMEKLRAAYDKLAGTNGSPAGSNNAAGRTNLHRVPSCQEPHY